MRDEKLTAQMEAFCINYTTKGDTFSNQTLSYSEAYNIPLEYDEKGKINYNTPIYKQCASNASRLFKNEKIQGKIKDIFLSRLNDSEIDARLSEIALHSEASSSIQAIKEYNNLKQRITKKIDITSAGRPLQGLSDDELKALAE